MIALKLDGHATHVIAANGLRIVLKEMDRGSRSSVNRSDQFIGEGTHQDLEEWNFHLQQLRQYLLFAFYMSSAYPADCAESNVLALSLTDVSARTSCSAFLGQMNLNQGAQRRRRRITSFVRILCQESSSLGGLCIGKNDPQQGDFVLATVTSLSCG